jgi:hypothetical protein
LEPAIGYQPEPEPPLEAVLGPHGVSIGNPPSGAELEGIDRVVTYVPDPELEEERARENAVAAAIDRAAELAAAAPPRRKRGRPPRVRLE